MASPAVRLAPTADVDEPPRLELVTVRKYGLDPDWSIWSKLWFYVVFLTLIRWSFKWFRVPSPTHMDADGRISWCEYICIATDAETAREFCVDEFYEHHPLPVNSPLPRASVQFSQHEYTKSKNPYRYTLAFPRVQSVKEVTQQESLARDFDAISQRILEQSRHRPTT